MYFRTSVCAVCPNHEVVVFQPWTGTAPDLGFIANYTFLFYPSHPTCINFFLGLFISLLYPTSTPSLAFVIAVPLFFTPSPPPLPAQKYVYLDVVPTRYPSASAAWLCAPRCVPESAAVSCVRSTPLCHPQPATRSLSDYGGSPSAGPSVSLSV